MLHKEGEKKLKGEIAELLRRAQAVDESLAFSFCLAACFTAKS